MSITFGIIKLFLVVKRDSEIENLAISIHLGWLPIGLEMEIQPIRNVSNVLASIRGNCELLNTRVKIV